MLLLKEKQSKKSFYLDLETMKLKIIYNKNKKLKILEINIKNNYLQTMVDYDLTKTNYLRITKIHNIATSKLENSLYGTINYEILEKE